MRPQIGRETTVNLGVKADIDCYANESLRTAGSRPSLRALAKSVGLLKADIRFDKFPGCVLHRRITALSPRRTSEMRAAKLRVNSLVRGSCEIRDTRELRMKNRGATRCLEAPTMGVTEARLVVRVVPR